MPGLDRSTWKKEDMTEKTLFEAYKLGSLTLSNRVVLAPLTRNRAGAGPIACQRGQDDAVAQGQRAQLVGFEQGFFSHVFFLPCRSVKPRHPSTASTHATRSQNSRNKHRTAMMMVII